MKKLFLALGLATLMVSSALAAGAPQTKNTVPAATSSFLTDLQTFLREEDAERFADQFTSFVVSNCSHGTGAGLVGNPGSCTAYPGGWLITETATITYPDADTGWVIVHKDTTGDAGTYTRVANTHYLIDFASASQPATPADSVLIMEVTTSGGAITAVTDNRTLSPGPPGTAILTSANIFTQDQEIQKASSALIIDATTGDAFILFHSAGTGFAQLVYDSSEDEISIANSGVGDVVTWDVATGDLLVGNVPYARLTLTNAVLNADINASAAIAYSKLNLTGAVLNADLAGSIAYSNLNLTGAILNADLAGSIAVSKLANGTDGELITWDSSGVAATVSTGTSGNVLTSNGAGAAPTFQVSTSSAFPSFSVHRNGTAQLNVTGLEKIRWTTELFDTNGNFVHDSDDSGGATESRFTPTIAGKYMFVVVIELNPTVSGDGLQIYLYKNGSIENVRLIYTNGTVHSMTLTSIIDANGSTDYFEIFAQNNARDTTDVSGTISETYWMGSRIGG